uniref:Uncharacterized protein n=1 Tax=Aegilops tauschii TaxID=37682 RepID=N1QXG7_AEGTA
MALQRPRLKGIISKPTILESWNSQGLAPRTEESSQPSWTHQGQGLHAAKAEVAATKTGSM